LSLIFYKEKHRKSNKFINVDNTKNAMCCFNYFKYLFVLEISSLKNFFVQGIRVYIQNLKGSNL